VNIGVKLKDSANEALEIMCFATRHQDGVIRCRTTLFENLDVASYLLRYPKKDVEKVLPRDITRATTRDEVTSRVQHIDCQPVQIVIGTKGFGKRAFAGGEFRGIEDHDIEALFLLAK